MILIHLLTQTLGIFLFSSCLQNVQLYWCSSSFSFPFLLFNTCKAFTYSQSAFNIKIKTTIYCFWSHSAALSPAAVVLFCFMSKLFKSFFILNQPLSYNHLCDWSDVAMICWTAQGTDSGSRSYFMSALNPGNSNRRLTVQLEAGLFPDSVFFILWFL